MDCDQAIERLPWLLNRSLTAEERRQVESHLGDCARCREALAETREAWEIFAQHVPAADLVAYAADEPSAIPGETLERHLASCPQCAAELEMARASRMLAENEDVAVMRPAVAPRGTARGLRLWQSSALAASLVGLVAIGGWVETANRAQELAASLAVARRPAATTLAPPARDREAPAPAAEDSQVAANQPILNLESEGDTTAVRAGGAAPPSPTLPPGATSATLVLQPSRRDTAKHHADELVDAAGKVHPLPELLLDKDAVYTVALYHLGPGTNTLRIYATDSGRVLVGSYPILRRRVR